MTIVDGATPFLVSYSNINGLLSGVYAIETVASQKDACKGCCFAKRQDCGTPCSPHRRGSARGTNFHKVKDGLVLKDESGRTWKVLVASNGAVLIPYSK